MAFDSFKRTSRAGWRALLVGGVSAAAVLALALGAYAYDHSRREQIAPGVTVGGVKLGGLRASAARARLRAELRAAGSRLVTVQYGTLRFTLTGGQAGLSANVDRAVAEGVRASRGGWFVGRTLRGLFGGNVDARVAMPVTYSRRAVEQFVAGVEHRVDRPARNATLLVDGSARLVKVPGARGAAVDASALRAQIDQGLASPGVAHAIAAPVRSIRPQITTAMLARAYPAYVVVDWPAFKLFLYQRLRLTHTYPIAVGQAGLETPPGLHHILDKQVDPSWYVPHSAWAGSLAGQVIPPGPQDPLVARWMATDDQGDGIHGTNEPWSIGSSASHGCIRMLVPDVIKLYSMTPLGAPVYVV